MFPAGFRAANRIPWNRPKKKSREILSEWWILENERSYKTIFPEIFPDKTDDLRLHGFEGRIDENELNFVLSSDVSDRNKDNYR